MTDFQTFLEKFLGEKYTKEIYAEEYIPNFEQTHSENKASLNIKLHRYFVTEKWLQEKSWGDYLKDAR